MDPPYRLRPRRIAWLYVCFAILWILGSDRLADLLFPGWEVQSFKGLAFVLATGGLLYAILGRAEASVREFQAHLLTSREQFERVVENAPEAILIQADGMLRYANPAGLRLLGARR